MKDKGGQALIERLRWLRLCRVHISRELRPPPNLDPRTSPPVPVSPAHRAYHEKRIKEINRGLRYVRHYLRNGKHDIA